MGQEPEPEARRFRGFLTQVRFPTRRGLPPKRRYLLMLTLFLVVVLIIVFIGIYSFETFQSKIVTPYSLAISTALSGPQEEAGQEALRGVQLYLNSVNRAGGVNGHRLNLLIFNDRDDPTVALQIAHQVVASPALLMLGPLYSNVALPTNPTYKNAHLPVISASVSNDSITNNNPFFFRLGTATTEEASTSATYALKILGFHTASVVYTDDTAYGIPTAKGFSTTFTASGGVVQSLRLAEDPARRQQTLNTIVTTLAHASGPRIIFLAMLDTDARQVIMALRRQGITTPLMNTDSPGSDSFAASFSSYPEERSQPGYFTNGLYASSPLLYDSAPAAAQAFAAQYQQTYDSAPGWHAAKYYEAAQVAVAALQAAILKDASTSVDEDRLQVAKQLGAINSPIGQ